MPAGSAVAGWEDNGVRFIGVIGGLIGVAINVPGAIDGDPASLVSLGFCAGLAVASLLLALIDH